jgi:formylglycine-generating enzyme required for sulfatase activity
MLIQRAGSGTLPPHGFTAPTWSTLVAQWTNIPPLTSSTVTIGPSIITLGHDDSEADDTLFTRPVDVTTHEFGWDNESPARVTQVASFKAEWRPVTNGQFYKYWKNEGAGKVKMPGSWVEVDNEACVCSHEAYHTVQDRTD